MGRRFRSIAGPGSSTLLALVVLRVLVLMGNAFASSLHLLGINSGGQHEQLTIMGRTAYVYKPSVMMAESSRKRAAIFVLHGSGSEPADMFNKGFDELAEVHSFLVVYPGMKIPRGDSWGYSEDILYFSALVHRLQDYGLDAARAFVCGHSAGGTMALFLQNEVDLFSGAGAVEAAVGHLQEWDMSKRGHRTMVIWNHADPVLEKFAPPGGEPAYYNLTVSTLRRHGSITFTSQTLPDSKKIISANLLHYPEDSAPQLLMLNFNSDPGTHNWADKSWCTFSAAEELVKFFLGPPF